MQKRLGVADGEAALLFGHSLDLPVGGASMARILNLVLSDAWGSRLPKRLRVCARTPDLENRG